MLKFKFLIILFCYFFAVNAQNTNNSLSANYSVYTDIEGSKNISSSVKLENQEVVIRTVGEPELRFTDVTYFTKQINLGLKCNVYHAKNLNNNTNYLIMVEENGQFYLLSSGVNTLAILSDFHIDREKVRTLAMSTFNCFHTDLSDQFDLGVMFNRVKESEYTDRTDYVSITILSKGMAIQSGFIELKSPDYSFYSNTFSGCERVSSFTKNIFMEEFSYDNFAGDIVVADFNFDGLDDIAVVREVSNRGEFYNFYIQNEGHKFSYDEFLTERLCQIPRQIDFIKKEYRKVERIGAWGYRETKFKFNSSSKKWEVLSEIHEH